MTRQPEAGMPVGALLASALMAANIPCDSGEDVDRLIAEMAKHGVRLIRQGSIEAALEGHFATGRHSMSLHACGVAVAMEAAALSDSGTGGNPRHEDAIAALRSLVGDHDIHPAHLPDCPICVALNGRTRFDRAPASKNTETPR